MQGTVLLGTVEVVPGSIVVNEEIHIGKRELYIYYPQGMGQSKLVISAAARGTARNMNTVAKLVALSLSS